MERFVGQNIRYEYMRVAIIGAGISGLSIAKRLSEKNNGLVIDVYEASAKSGGRISSFDWRLKNKSVFSCDNGQHFTIGAYTDFIELLDKCDALKYWTRHSFEWNMLRLHGDDLHDLLQFKIKKLTLFNKTLVPYIKFVKTPTKLFFLKFYFSLFLLKNKFFHKQSLNCLYRKFFFSNASINLFWKAFVESSMNTEFENSDVSTLSFLVNECVKDIPTSLEILIPETDYYSCAIKPIEKNLQQNGINFHFNSVVERIHPEKKIKCRGILSHSYDTIFLAVPGHIAAKIWKRSKYPATKESILWENQKYRHILNMWVVLPSAKAENNSNKKEESFLWNPIEFKGSFYVVVIQKKSKQPNIMSIIRSACNDINLSEEEENLYEFAQKLLNKQYSVDLKHLDYKLIRAKRATIACTHDQCKRSTIWSGTRTGIKDIYKCSDEASFNYPSTIEGAVRSGYLAAENIKRFD